jgi:hypothetical protein
VCHLRDPSSFYVHRAADAVTLENLGKQLRKHAHTFTKPPESVLKGTYEASILVSCSDFQTACHKMLGLYGRVQKDPKAFITLAQHKYPSVFLIQKLS